MDLESFIDMVLTIACLAVWYGIVVMIMCL